MKPITDRSRWLDREMMDTIRRTKYRNKMWNVNLDDYVDNFEEQETSQQKQLESDRDAMKRSLDEYKREYERKLYVDEFTTALDSLEDGPGYDMAAVEALKHKVKDVWASNNKQEVEKQMARKPKPEEMFTADERDKIWTVKQKLLPLIGHIPTNNPQYIVCGGVFPSLFHGEKPNDIDVFVINAGSVPATKLPKYNANTFLREEREKYDSAMVYSCYKDSATNTHYVLSKYKTREEVLEDFDYVHCCVSFAEGKLYISPTMYHAIMEKKLVVNNAENVEDYRTVKFERRGWTNPEGNTFHKIVGHEWSDPNQTDFE